MIDALLESFRLKDQVRAGWRLRGVRDPESVADHSWGTAYLVLLYAGTEGVDRARAVEIAIVHDLAEALTGDVPTRIASLHDQDTTRDKAMRERSAMTTLTASMDERERTRVMSLWLEYEERTTPEARFVRDMNLVDMCAQAFRYENDLRYDDAPNPHFPDFAGLDEFFATTEPRLSTPTGRTLFEEIAAKYTALSSVATRGGLSRPEDHDERR